MCETLAKIKSLLSGADKKSEGSKHHMNGHRNHRSLQGPFDQCDDRSTQTVLKFIEILMVTGSEFVNGTWDQGP